MKKYFSNINFIIQDHKTTLELVELLWELSKYEKVLVLNGDIPLIQTNELEKFDIPNVNHCNVCFEVTIVQMVMEE